VHGVPVAVYVQPGMAAGEVGLHACAVLRWLDGTSVAATGVLLPHARSSVHSGTPSVPEPLLHPWRAMAQSRAVNRLMGTTFRNRLTLAGFQPACILPEPVLSGRTLRGRESSLQGGRA
jgi:hypothetical protein